MFKLQVSVQRDDVNNETVYCKVFMMTYVRSLIFMSLMTETLLTQKTVF